MKYRIVFRNSKETVEWVTPSQKINNQKIPKLTTKLEFGKNKLNQAIVNFISQINSMSFICGSTELALLEDETEIAYSFLTHSTDEFDRWRIRWCAPKSTMDKIYNIIKTRKNWIRCF